MPLLTKKKKKGKGSKLARMSEEEKARYLQHRAELELEAKRRKQQLIAVFTKNKLKREEAFARLNNAKINEQWRLQLRQIKCKELYDHLEYLWNNFNDSLRARDAKIAELYRELEKADIDHHRLQQVHIDMMDQYMERHYQRLQALSSKYGASIAQIRDDEGLEELTNAKNQLLQEVKRLEIVVFAEKNFLEGNAIETRTRNAIYTRTIEYSETEIFDDLMRRCIGGKFLNLWSGLATVIKNYQIGTNNKRKEYETLKENDDYFHLQSNEFPHQQIELLKCIKVLKNQEKCLAKKRNKEIEELSDQVELLNKQYWKLRQDLRINQMTDGILIKRQAMASSCAVRDLKKLRNKASILIMLIKICQNGEPTGLNVGDAADYRRAEEIAIDPYKKLENFWKRYNLIKTDTILLKREQNLFLIEYSKLKHCLRSYLTSAVTYSSPK